MDKADKFIPNASIGANGDQIAMDRKGFLNWLTIGWLAFAAATGGFFLSMIRFLFPNVLFEPPQSFKIGYPEEFVPGNVDIRFKKKYNIWVVRNEEGIYALSTVCTHLGCTPNWLASEQKFKCPCHGSGFRSSGINFEGPAPRPLERFMIYLAGDGQIVVDKTKSFKFEKGEWEREESFLEV
jgi:cytochrome b6-f complex iron-sulfur subunit